MAAEECLSGGAGAPEGSLIALDASGHSLALGTILSGPPPSDLSTFLQQTPLVIVMPISSQFIHCTGTMASTGQLVTPTHLAVLVWDKHNTITKNYPCWLYFILFKNKVARIFLLVSVDN